MNSQGVRRDPYTEIDCFLSSTLLIKIISLMQYIVDHKTTFTKGLAESWQNKSRKE